MIGGLHDLWMSPPRRPLHHYVFTVRRQVKSWAEQRFLESHNAMNKHAPIFDGKPLDRDGDYTTEPGAYTLARRIRAFWQARGFNPTVWVEKLTLSSSPTDERERFIVKSDMVAGLPRPEVLT